MGHDHRIVGQHERLERATAALDPPLAVVDLDAFDANAADLVRRAAGKPIRVASKSVRCRALLRRALAGPGFAGVLAFTLPEALWLADGASGRRRGRATRRPTGRPCARSPPTRSARGRVTLMVDSAEHLDLIDAVLGTPAPRAAGVPRSRRVAAAARAAGAPRRAALPGPRARRRPRRWPRRSVARPGFRLVGVMAYEAQIAGRRRRPPGQPLRNAVLRAAQRASIERAARAPRRSRRRGVGRGAAGVRQRRRHRQRRAHRRRVGGHRGRRRLGALRADAVRRLPRVHAPSRPRCSRPRSCAARRPASRPCSAAAGRPRARPGKDRLPAPVYPAGLALTALEGAGEVQTPLTGAAAAPAAASATGSGSATPRRASSRERVNVLHLVEGDEIVAEAAHLPRRGPGAAVTPPRGWWTLWRASRTVRRRGVTFGE